MRATLGRLLGAHPLAVRRLGSSLAMSPANDMPRVALEESGAKLILLNCGETPFDEETDLRIDAGIGEVPPPVVERVKALRAGPPLSARS